MSTTPDVPDALLPDVSDALLPDGPGPDGRGPDATTPAAHEAERVVTQHGTFRAHPVSFVRRSGRLTDGQARALERSGPQMLLDVPRDVARTSVDPAWRLDVAEVFGRTAPLVVEVGSGMGENAVAAAAADPSRDVLALEVYLPGLAQAVLAGDRDGVTNLRLAQVNAPELFATALAPASVDEVWVFFPDPWHKTRHHKRRLVQPSFCDEVARVLRPGGVWRLATDWEPYADHVREVLRGRADLVPLVAGSDGVVERFDGRVLTTFEAKGLRAGRTITDLAYVRV
ncbi:tRNA (guanosine(46)-N7)-methyltransferase TrmB [Flavimobilis sp. GY10621]|uniref:tRNA (guanine-N(7)-)-methyltransferase n=1 Tax=Flavimobilis rhizosphaerae TaxID=2775421 RepID=A0ABR9DSZ5_9MICO|nr:tRNA (guanosine(46)-N7)-methyltransferase TrmB [Flavimobilis rhizosphaerae]MBD9699100.1 tRNA (guanosine(46)-N7)-methyltransferase TrmB [Flavimobilis rhizosphaerae]